MPKYRKKPIVIEAEQWFKNGDFSKDESELITVEGGLSFLSEGKVVRLYRDPEYADQRACWHCKEQMKAHGWIDTLEGGHIVCPGDWILTGVKQEYYPCKPDIFEKSYELVVEETEWTQAAKLLNDTARPLLTTEQTHSGKVLKIAP